MSIDSIFSPQKKLHKILKEYPGINKLIHLMVKQKAKVSKSTLWPEWCFIPCTGWFAIISQGKPIEKMTNIERAEYGDAISRVAPILTWQYSQGIYRFDPDLYSEIIKTEIADEFPSDIFYRLPEWCIYVETQDLIINGVKTFGFWCYLDTKSTDTEIKYEFNEIRFLFNGGKNGIMPLLLYLKNIPLNENLKLMINKTQEI